MLLFKEDTEKPVDIIQVHCSMQYENDLSCYTRALWLALNFSDV